MRLNKQQNFSLESKIKIKKILKFVFLSLHSSIIKQCCSITLRIVQQYCPKISPEWGSSKYSLFKVLLILFKFIFTLHRILSTFSPFTSCNFQKEFTWFLFGLSDFFHWKGWKLTGTVSEVWIQPIRRQSTGTTVSQIKTFSCRFTSFDFSWLGWMSLNTIVLKKDQKWMNELNVKGNLHG